MCLAVRVRKGETAALPVAGASIAAKRSALRDVRVLEAGEGDVGALQGD